MINQFNIRCYNNFVRANTDNYIQLKLINIFEICCRSFFEISIKIIIKIEIKLTNTKIRIEYPNISGASATDN